MSLEDGDWPSLKSPLTSKNNESAEDAQLPATSVKTSPSLASIVASRQRRRVVPSNGEMFMRPLSILKSKSHRDLAAPSTDVGGNRMEVKSNKSVGDLVLVTVNDAVSPRIGVKSVDTPRLGVKSVTSLQNVVATGSMAASGKVESHQVLSPDKHEEMDQIAGGSETEISALVEFFKNEARNITNGETKALNNDRLDETRVQVESMNREAGDLMVSGREAEQERKIKERSLSNDRGTTDLRFLGQRTVLSMSGHDLLNPKYTSRCNIGNQSRRVEAGIQTMWPTTVSVSTETEDRVTSDLLAVNMRYSVFHVK